MNFEQIETQWDRANCNPPEPVVFTDEQINEELRDVALTFPWQDLQECFCFDENSGTVKLLRDDIKNCIGFTSAKNLAALGGLVSAIFEERWRQTALDRLIERAARS